MFQAYDSVNREKMFGTLEKLGLGPKFIRTIKSMYSGDSITTQLHGLNTKPLYLGRGLRQGCSLSPLLFALYIRGMGEELCNSRVGVKLGDICISSLFFADDLAQWPDLLL